MASTLEKLEDGTLKLKVTIPSASVVKAKEEVLEETTKKADVAGFRKGKAPKKLVEDKIDPERLHEDVLKKILPLAYVEAVKEHNLKPIINPKIHVEKLGDPSPPAGGSGQGGEDWVFFAETCEMPEVILEDYKKKVKEVTAKSKIIIPGKEKEEVSFDAIMKALLESVKVSIPRLLTEHEADRLLSQTLDEIKRLGLTLDQYLASTNKTPEQLRTEYQAKANSDMTIEFALQKVAETEKIAVEEKEIEEAIQKAKTPEEKQHLEANRYLLAGIIRQQKTLDFLKNL